MEAILSSETCALDMLGARFVREIENGEIVVITESGLESFKPFPKEKFTAMYLRIYLLCSAR